MRKEFVEEFDEETAVKLEDAATEHWSMHLSKDKGSDKFLWAVMMCIGHECFTHDIFVEYHGIKRGEDIKPWLIKHGREWIAGYDGYCDSLALVAGFYDEYVKE